MPKTNDASGPTYYGMEGHVVDSHDRVHEVDPSRTVTGEVVEGFESDEREIEDRSTGAANEVAPQISPSDGLPAGPTPIEGMPAKTDAEQRARDAEENPDGETPGAAKRSAPEKEEVASSRGSSSSASRVSNARSAEKRTSGN
jgi:hypothetical protein